MDRFWRLPGRSTTHLEPPGRARRHSGTLMHPPGRSKVRMHLGRWDQHWEEIPAAECALRGQARHQERRQRAALGINRSIPCPPQAWTQGTVPSKLQAADMFAAKEQEWLACKRPVRATRDAPDLVAFALVAVLADITPLPALCAALPVLAASTLIAKTPGVLCLSFKSKLSPLSQFRRAHLSSQSLERPRRNARSDNFRTVGGW